LLRLYTRLTQPHKVTQGHWVVKFIRIMPMSGRWTEVTWGLKQLVTGLRGFVPFTCRGLVEFLTVTEDVLGTVGYEQRLRIN